MSKNYFDEQTSAKRNEKLDFDADKVEQISLPNRDKLVTIQLSELEDMIRNIVVDAINKYYESKVPKKYYTMREAAARLDKAVSTMYTEHSKGHIKGFKSGRHVRFSEEQLCAYLEGRNPD